MGNLIPAVIDADFFNTATQNERGTGLFLRIMHDLNLHPVMHRFVADTELKSNSFLPDLIESDQLTVLDYEDYLLCDQEKQEYEEYFHEAFEKINHFAFPKDKDIYNYASPRENLGELRSLYMAMKKIYPYFMSNDGGSRLLAKTFFSNRHKIDVKSLYDALIQCKDTGTHLTWKDISPTVTIALRSRQDRIKNLKSLYHTDTPADT